MNGAVHFTHACPGAGAFQRKLPTDDSKEVLRSVDAMPELHLSSQNLSTVCGIDFTTWVMRQLIRKEPHACKCTLLEQSMELQAEIKALDPRLVGRERNRQPGLRTMETDAPLHVLANAVELPDRLDAIVNRRDDVNLDEPAPSCLLHVGAVRPEAVVGRDLCHDGADMQVEIARRDAKDVAQCSPHRPDRDRRQQKRQHHQRHRFLNCGQARELAEFAICLRPLRQASMG